MDTSTPRRTNDGDSRKPCPVDLSTRSRTPSPVCTRTTRSAAAAAADSLSNLHRVTDMLKDKLNNTNSSNTKSAAKDFDVSSPPPASDHNVSSGAESSRKSPAFHQSPVAGSAAVTANKSGSSPATANGNMETTTSSTYQPLPPHHMSMLLGQANTSDMYNNANPDSSNVLRGILQGKDRMASREAEDDKPTTKRYGGNTDVYGRTADAKNGSVGGDSDVESYRSGSPGNLSFDDSDPERRANGVSDTEDTGPNDGHKDSVMGDLDDDFMDSNQDNSIPSDDEETSRRGLKRSASAKNNDSMELSPSAKSQNSLDGLLTPPERRPKRKQYIPQQHGSLEPSSKLRKLEKQVLQKQLKQMQQQLAIMQQRYCELFDQGEVPDLMDQGQSEHDPKLGCNKNKARYGSSSPISALDFDPSHFIKQASKLVQEQEMLSKDSDSRSASPSGAKAPSDMHNLARMLKDELAHSVASLVDSVVAKFVDRNCTSSSKSLPSPPSQTTVIPPLVKPKKELARVPTPPATVSEPEVSSKPSKCPSPSTGANSINNNSIASNNNNNNNNSSNINNNNDVKDLSASGASKFPPSSHSSMSLHHHPLDSMAKPPRTKVTDKLSHSFLDGFHPKPFSELARAHPALFPPPPYFPTQIPPIQPLYAKEPEQTEAMSLVLGTPNKKKRTKVTDTRLSPRAARALLQESLPHSYDGPKQAAAAAAGHLMGFGDYSHPLIPMSLPTSVAIPNPSLQHSDILAMYSTCNSDHAQFMAENGRRGHSPSGSPNLGGHSAPSASMDNYNHSIKDMEHFEQMMTDSYNYEGSHAMTSTLTPMHLRKAKLMFFYVRYPSSSILKIYFPDIKFNKNNTAQLVKWFSNFREFFYIQMEKYSRQALAEGVKNAEDLIVTTESELYRILNLHYNRNNQIDVPDNFRVVVQATLREFFRAIQTGKDAEQSWKKAIYKVIARMDDALPEYFKSPNWMEQLNDA